MVIAAATATAVVQTKTVRCQPDQAFPEAGGRTGRGGGRLSSPSRDRGPFCAGRVQGQFVSEVGVLDRRRRVAGCHHAARPLPAPARPDPTRRGL